MNTIWKRIQDDENKALEELFELYYKMMCLYIVQLTRNIEDAEDIVQETFIKLWTNRYSIKINTSLKAYLFRSAYNLTIDKIRKEKKKELFLLELQYEALLSQIEDESYSKEKVNKMKSLIDKLPKKCKEILLLSKREGLKNTEIASQLNISIKTVESQMRIAFQKIRKGYQKL